MQPAIQTPFTPPSVEPLARPNETPSVATSEERASIEIRQLSAWYGKKQALDDITLTIPEKQVMAIIGPSGCGKSTLIRCLNRMHEVAPHARAEGEVIMDDRNIYDPSV